MKVLTQVLVTLPIYGVFCMFFPGEWELWEQLSIGLTSGMLSISWMNSLRG